MTVSASICTVNQSYPDGTALPVYDAIPYASEAISHSGTSAQSSNSIPAVSMPNVTFVWRIATDTAIWVKFGDNPTAAAGDDFFLPAGVVQEWVGEANDKVAVINA